jgi:hypothetical protein
VCEAMRQRKMGAVASGGAHVAPLNAAMSPMWVGNVPEREVSARALRDKGNARQGLGKHAARGGWPM